ncbi:MAG: GspE/PulE family protein [Patescibacteria group bacterium]|jgi:type IV pilus assembly protein PilB
MMSFFTKEDQYNKLWHKLEKSNLLTKEAFNKALRFSKQADLHIIEALFEQNASQSEKLSKIFADYYKLPWVTLRRKVIANYVINLIPKEVAEQNSVVIFKKLNQNIHVALTNPDNKQVIEFIKRKTGLEPEVHLTSPLDIKDAIRNYPSEIKSEFALIIEDSLRQALASREPPEKIAEFVPVIKIVDTIIEQALAKNASDIHIEPSESFLTIRFRIDGLLNKIVELPKATLPPLLTRIKLLSNLKIDEFRIPQDGRFNISFQSRDVAIRVSIIPTLYGSKIVMRLLDRKRQEFTLKKLGLNKKDFAIVKKEITKPFGMILVTGPTGSGKTTTLYAILRMLNKEGVNISTIEDPIEYGLAGISQTQINPVAGLTFANGLKSLLRQDPNILMVGEIRDLETASLAVNAAMTGHLVLSTLHTNSAYQTMQRLIEMDIQPFLAASVTNLIIGQRLVRQICNRCKVRVEARKKLLEKYSTFFSLESIWEKLKKLNLLASQSIKSFQDNKLYYGKGCQHCNQTGFKGRLGIYEVLEINNEIHQAILKNYSSDAIKKVALAQNSMTMVEDGLLKVFNGLTTFEEVLRETRE